MAPPSPYGRRFTKSALSVKITVYKIHNIHVTWRLRPVTGADSLADGMTLTLSTDVAFNVELTSRDMDSVPALEQLTSG